MDVGEQGGYVNMDSLVFTHDDFILSMACLLIISWIKVQQNNPTLIQNFFPSNRAQNEIKVKQ